MTEPPTSSANLRKPHHAEIGAGMRLDLWVQDPEVINELQQRDDQEREKYALTALRVGVIALRQAGGFVDAEKLKSQGELILKELDGRLKEYSARLDKELAGELKRYFNPDDGHFQQNVRALVDKDGELARRLQEHVSGDSSLLARQLAEAVGESSPLMRYLDATNKEGLIERIAGIAETRLKEQSDRVLSEFDLNKEDSALNRLIRDVKAINSEIGEKFNPDDESSVLNRLNKALESTREQIHKDLTLDDRDSSLSRLQAGLQKQLEELAKKQLDFQTAVSEQLGIKQVQARTTEGGFSFEHLAAEALKTRISALGDEFQSVGETPGVLKRKTGDHLHTMGAESAVPGAKIVYECKRDKRYRMKVALEELAEARKNRESEIGVFIMAAETLRGNDALRSEYPSALVRHGNDVIAVWDPDDPATDIVLDAAIGVARSLVVRAARAADDDDAEELDELNVAIKDIEKQFERFGKMDKWCDDISGTAENLKIELGRVLKRLRLDVAALNEGVDSLQDRADE
jgi:hypothetical protein